MFKDGGNFLYKRYLNRTGVLGLLFQCSALGLSSMWQLLWQTVDRSTAGPNGFHISWLSPVFWPADRKQPNSLPLYSVCVVCTGTESAAWEVYDVMCSGYSSSREALHADILTLSFKSYENAWHVIHPLVSSLSKSNKKKYIYMGVCWDWQTVHGILETLRPCLPWTLMLPVKHFPASLHSSSLAWLCLFWKARNRIWGDNSQYVLGPFGLTFAMRHCNWENNKWLSKWI